ncbi:MAG: hypothetical protein QM535_06065 [Limnohabitans sp.]|nr:hypothetical protein [Limnohabitans sp.]
MTKELKLSIENLYEFFSVYPLGSEITGCPCCVSNTDKEKIHSKPLKELEGEDLDRYAFKAMTTWGNVEDFKHFLPRIFELLSTGNLLVDTFIVLGKLEYAKWTTWKETEQEVIKVFLLEWWTDMSNNRTYFDIYDFVEIYKIVGDLNQLLDRWEINFEDNSFKNLIYFIEYYFDDMANYDGWFKKAGSIFKDDIFQWFKSKKKIIEEGFFYYEKSNDEFVENISNALYLVENVE